MRQKGFVGLPILIIVLLLGILGYYTLQKSQAPKNQIESITSDPTPMPTAISPVISRSPNYVDWSAYTETREVKFSIEYPSNWIVDTKDGMYGSKGARFDSDKEAIGSVGVNWNSSPVEPNCNSPREKKESIQLKDKTIEMCHYLGSTQEPEGYFYNGISNGVNYSIVTANYAGDRNRKIILKVLSTLQI